MENLKEMGFMEGASMKENANLLDNAELVQSLASQQKLPDARVRAILNALNQIIADSLRSGMAVRIAGLGVFHVRDVVSTSENAAQRNGKRIGFRPAKKLNEAANISTAGDSE